LDAVAARVDIRSQVVSQYRIAKGSQSMLVSYAIDAEGKAQLLYFEPDKEYGTREV
jgi:hypothetical protein